MQPHLLLEFLTLFPTPSRPGSMHREYVYTSYKFWYVAIYSLYTVYMCALTRIDKRWSWRFIPWSILFLCRLKFIYIPVASNLWTVCARTERHTAYRPYLGILAATYHSPTIIAKKTWNLFLKDRQNGVLIKIYIIALYGQDLAGTSWCQLRFLKMTACFGSRILPCQLSASSDWSPYPANLAIYFPTNWANHIWWTKPPIFDQLSHPYPTNLANHFRSTYS
jgi:hypothetical protein